MEMVDYLKKALLKYSRTCGNPVIIYYAFQLPEQNGMPAIEVLAYSLKKKAA